MKICSHLLHCSADEKKMWKSSLYLQMMSNRRPRSSRLLMLGKGTRIIILVHTLCVITVNAVNSKYVHVQMHCK